MVIIVGLIILVAAVVVGVGGVLSNHGSGHALNHSFALFGYHVTGSSGRLFLYGIVVGAAAVLGLCLLLAAARRTSRRGAEARRGLTESRRETAAVSQQRDDLLDERQTARSYTASTLGTRPVDGSESPDGVGDDADQRGRWRLFGRRPVSVRPAEEADAYAAGDSPADVSAPAE
jgi:hypothetical protein